MANIELDKASWEKGFSDGYSYKRSKEKAKDALAYESGWTEGRGTKLLELAEARKAGRTER